MINFGTKLLLILFATKLNHSVLKMFNAGARIEVFSKSPRQRIESFNGTFVYVSDHRLRIEFVERHYNITRFTYI